MLICQNNPLWQTLCRSIGIKYNLTAADKDHWINVLKITWKRLHKENWFSFSDFRYLDQYSKLISFSISNIEGHCALGKMFRMDKQILLTVPLL